MEADAASVDRVGVPMRICPRGCEYREVGRHAVEARTQRWGRAKVLEQFTFEATHCAICGARLKDRCDRCGNVILAASESRCRFCGVPYAWARDRALVRNVVRRWQKTAIPIYEYEGKGVYLFDGDITRIKIDAGAIVSTDDTDGAMWSDVAHAISVAAGSEVERQSVDNGGYQLGEAWYTDAGALDIDGIVHVAAMTSSGETKLEIVRECVAAAHDLAEKKGLRTLALPAVGSGTSGLDLNESVAVISEESARRAHRTSSPLESSVIVLFERQDLETVADHARAAARQWDASTDPQRSR